MGDTPCKMCSFAEYKGDTQIGCSLNFIDKYKEVGATVIEAYDEDKEFYVIKNRYCRGFRPYRWIEALGLEVTEEEIIERIDEETKITTHVIILTKEDDLPIDVYKTTRSLEHNQDVTPMQVTVVRHPKAKIGARDLETLFEFSPFKWRMENLLFSIGDMDPEKLVHNAQKTCKSQYFTFCHAGFRYPDNFLTRINSLVNDELMQFGMVKIDEDSEGYLVPNHVYNHWYFNGDPRETIKENIEGYQCQNPSEKVVIQWKFLES